MSRPILCALPLALALACGDKGGEDPPVEADADTDADTDSDTDADLCGTAGQELPEGTLELAYDDGGPEFVIDDMTWSFDGTTLIAEQVLNESVAFQLEHPARVYGFSVRWANTEDLAEDAELVANLAFDFGHNGFDFWPDEPLWEGSRCAGDVASGEWLVYAFDEPVEVPHPGLVHVTHQRQEALEPAFFMDGSFIGEGTCADWGDCRSALNLPKDRTYYNGLTTTIPYDFLVRLHVEYTEEVDAADKFFQPVDGISLHPRQAWGDYDNDGDADLFSPGPTLMRNNGDGTFTDVSAESGLADMGLASSGGTWGDYDNDGCLDLINFVESYSASDALLHNECDGTFTDVTAASGITDLQDYYLCEGNEAYDRQSTPAASWFDVDGDGLLDLFLPNFICWNDGRNWKDQVWHNEGDGLFTEWTGTNGFTSARLASRGANPIDADLDGDIDILVNNYRLDENLYYENLGDGTVEEVAEDVGLAGNRDYNGAYYYGHTIGTAWGDLDNDGDFDSVQANLAHPRFFDFSDKTQVLINQGDGTWQDNQGDWAYPLGAAGLRYQETHSVPVLGDFDQDGVLDLGISAVYPGRPTDFYWGLGDGTFELDAYHSGLDVTSGWGMTAVDFDLDGDLDIGAQGVLYRNEVEGQGHWLQLRLVGDVASNRAAIGATAWIEAGGKTWLRYVSGGNGQGDQDDQTLHAGLGEETIVDRVTVAFPGGETVVYEGPFDADQRLWLYESGGAESGWAPPSR